MKYSKIKSIGHGKISFCCLFSPTLFFPFSTVKRLWKEIIGNAQFKLAETLTKLNWECLVIFLKIIKCSLELCLNYSIKWCP